MADDIYSRELELEEEIAALRLIDTRACEYVKELNQEIEELDSDREWLLAALKQLMRISCHIPQDFYNQFDVKSRFPDEDF